MNQQRNHLLRTDSSRDHWRAYINFTGQIFALDSTVFKTQHLFSSHGGFLTYVIYHHWDITN